MRTEAQTDRHDKSNSRFSQFCERALKKKQPSRTDEGCTEQVRAEPFGSLHAAGR
jgi:hypothetical protein